MPSFAVSENASPKVRTASVQRSCKVDAMPSPVCEASCMALWNKPPSLVARRIASATISKLIFPSPIMSFNSDMDFPVSLEIIVKGLKPWLTICKRSWPMSFPCDFTCANTSERPWNFCASPKAISPIVLRAGITSSTDEPKERSSLEACDKSPNVSGVEEAKARRSFMCSFAASMFPSKTLKSVVAFSNLNASPIAFVNKEATERMAPTPISHAALTLAI